MAAVCSQFGISGCKSRRQAKTAGVLNGLPDTLRAAQDGWITMDQAQLVAESHARAPITPEEELELVALAIAQDCDQFRRTVAAWEDRRRADGGMSRIERQRARRSAKVFDGDNDMVVVYAELDRIAGERIKAALESLNSRMLRDNSTTGAERTFEQRNADALVALITQQPAAARSNWEHTGTAPSGRIDLDEAGCGNADAGIDFDESSGGNADGEIDFEEAGAGDLAPQKTVLVVTVDFDAVSGTLENAGLIDGTPIGEDELRRIACDADIVPTVFSADGQPLYLGRRQRSATHAQKLALYRRDRGCIGCGMRPTACDAHHIRWWDKGGPTDIANLVLLCPRCHDKVHKHGHFGRKTPYTGLLHPQTTPKTRAQSPTTHTRDLWRNWKPT